MRRLRDVLLGRGGDTARAAAISILVLFVLTVPVCLLRTPDVDEFFIVWSAARWRLGADIWNNPPLFNALAATLQTVVPFPWAFVLSPIPLVAVLLVVWRFAAREGLPIRYVCAGLLLVQGSLLAPGSYYRSYSLLLAFLALAFDAWNESKQGSFAIFSALASLTHHLGSFVTIGTVVVSRFTERKLPFYALLGVLPSLCLAAVGFPGKHQDVHSWGLGLAQIWPTWWLGLVATLVFLARGTGAIRRLALWSLIQHAVVLGLMVIIPIRSNYLWITAVPVSLLFACALRDIETALRPARRVVLDRAVTALIAIGLVGSLVVVGAEAVVMHRRRAQLAQALTSSYERHQRILFYPDSDFAPVQQAFSDLNHLRDYPERLGPYTRRNAPPDGPLVTYEADNGSRLDVLRLHTPFVIEPGYDALFLRIDAPEVAAVPAQYALEADTVEWKYFVRRPDER